jgi:hypothetical protein
MDVSTANQITQEIYFLIFLPFGGNSTPRWFAGLSRAILSATIFDPSGKPRGAKEMEKPSSLPSAVMVQAGITDGLPQLVFLYH